MKGKKTKMKKYSIAVNPLDGVGKELQPFGVKALQKAQEIVGGFELDFQWYDGGKEWSAKTGLSLPENFRENMEAADAMYNQSAGYYTEEMAKPGAKYKKDNWGGVIFRGGLGNTIGLRPLTLLPGFYCPLKGIERIDIYLLRELSEGNYITPGKIVNNFAAYDTQVVTRPIIEKIVEYGFKLAMNRAGRLSDGKKIINLGNKDGGIACTDFYRQIMLEIAPKYPQVEIQFTQIDALCEHLVKDPDRFDVIVCENMHGDIVGDIGALLAGGMGVTPTGDIGGITPHFRPNHGSFPRAIGKNFCNPIATFMTGSLMLEVLANDNQDEALRAAAILIKKAVEYNLVNGGARTKDMGGTAGTDVAAEAIIDCLSKVKA